MRHGATRASDHCPRATRNVRQIETTVSNYNRVIAPVSQRNLPINANTWVSHVPQLMHRIGPITHGLNKLAQITVRKIRNNHAINSNDILSPTLTFYCLKCATALDAYALTREPIHSSNMLPASTNAVARVWKRMNQKDTWQRPSSAIMSNP